LTIVCGVFWTLVGAGAQAAWIAAIAGGAYLVKAWIERHHDREDERRRKNR
jgi:hypothetical protein